MSTQQPSENTTRANPQIWKLAEWLHENIKRESKYWHITWSVQEANPEKTLPDWNTYKNHMYDKAKRLLYMIHYNAFTGEDDHLD